MPIDESRPFIPVRIAVLTVSDTRTFEDDRSGDTLADRITKAGHVLADRAIVTDDADRIVEQMASWVEDPHVDVIISTGGTGVTGRDVTPEAVEAICDRIIPGFGELFRWLSFAKIGTSTLQSRAFAGLANATFLFALPGSTSACRTGWEKIVSPQLDARTKPCNLANLRPRLRES